MFLWTCLWYLFIMFAHQISVLRIWIQYHWGYVLKLADTTISFSIFTKFLSGLFSTTILKFIGFRLLDENYNKPELALRFGNSHHELRITQHIIISGDNDDITWKLRLNYFSSEIFLHQNYKVCRKCFLLQICTAVKWNEPF